ncbi:iron complex transport system substrate-binding protein [Sphingopyxis panaciterrae]|uniref:ABC transporter substrate-binding protein n=1 Tax=Sphingopyxis panaciterrae TaxID=363841 RepID=UPI00142381D8|nr:ABC transporter substrate-binding protein [Sphingopyxis panaciterrae]NIJ39183.1 iron complex transport system substrate-binding protein [Sphingopyxis panaciterrae]
MRRAPLLLLASLAIAGAGAAALWAATARPAAQRHKPQRIVSLNLCTDQLILALADRDQIAGLTRNAGDPEMSAEATKAHGLRLMRNSAEEILILDPDLVAGMPLPRATLGVVEGQNYRTLDLQSANTLAEIQAAIRATAMAVGHPARGEAMIADMDRQLATVVRPGKGRVAAYYQRRGYMTGTGTLIDDLMTRVGVVNLAAKLGKPPLSQLSLEEMVAAEPDLLIVESATDRVTDQGSEMLHHPALQGIPRISISQAWTVCGSPAYATAARSMADQIARVPVRAH